MSKGQEKKGIFKLLNLFDIVVIILVILCAAILYFVRGQAAPAPSAETVTVRYTIELTNMYSDAADMIEPGDLLVDRVKKFDLGTVINVETYPTLRQSEDRVNGAYIETEASSLDSALITIEAQSTQTDSQISIGGYILRVGTTISVKGPGYGGVGYVLGIERGDEN